MIFQVTLKVPEQLDNTTPKPKPPGSPMPKRNKPVIKPQPQLQYNVPEGVKNIKVAGQRSKKPTLASQWRAQKEKQKMEEQVIQDRKDSFCDENWPHDPDTGKPNVTTLAEAGFFYLGLNDCVQCTVCEIVLNGWHSMSEPDPWIQHAKTSPGCAFLEKAKGAAWLEEVRNMK